MANEDKKDFNAMLHNSNVTKQSKGIFQTTYLHRLYDTPRSAIPLSPYLHL